MKFSYSLALLLLSIISYGQENPYWFTDDIKKKVADSTQSQSWRSQMAATYYSISGQYKPALESWDDYSDQYDLLLPLFVFRTLNSFCLKFTQMYHFKIKFLHSTQHFYT